jgi:integrase
MERMAVVWATVMSLTESPQGEVLGLRWSDVDLDLSMSQTRRRPVCAHGCGETYGKKAAGSCPSRVLVNGESGDTKSDAGRCVVGLPVQLVELLREQRRAQDADREHARQIWQEGGWVFTSTVGKPLILNSDYHRWKALLKEAGVRDGRLHDARHTAATVLLVLGVPARTVMGIMGWSSTSMAARYQHVTDPIRRAVADQVGSLLWSEDDGREKSTETAGRIEAGEE